MRIPTTKTPPPAAELLEILKHELSSQYSYKLFGVGDNKTIMVGKSTFVGAQISVNGNEIVIQSVPPSVPASSIFSIMAFTEFAFVLAFLGWGLKTKWVKLEKELGTFLHHKYN
jgi:hypothetical protein